MLLESSLAEGLHMNIPALYLAMSWSPMFNLI